MLSTMRSSNSMSGYSLGHLAADAQEQAVGALHDVGLVHGRDLVAAVLARVLEGEARDALRALARDDLDALGGVRRRPCARCRRRGPRCSRARSPGRCRRSGCARPRSTWPGRRQAYRSSSLRRATLTLRKPWPTGVVIGPLMATLLRRIESSTCSGSGVPYSSITPRPASWHLPQDGHAGGSDDGLERRGQLGAGAVAGDEGHRVGHRVLAPPSGSAKPPCFLTCATRPPSVEDGDHHRRQWDEGDRRRRSSGRAPRRRRGRPRSSSCSPMPPVSHCSTGSPTLMALRKKIRAKLWARTAPAPASLMMRGACSRLEPRPKLRPPTTKSPGAHRRRQTRAAHPRARAWRAPAGQCAGGRAGRARCGRWRCHRRRATPGREAPGAVAVT